MRLGGIEKKYLLNPSISSHIPVTLVLLRSCSMGRPSAFWQGIGLTHWHSGGVTSDVIDSMLAKSTGLLRTVLAISNPEPETNFSRSVAENKRRPCGDG